MGSPLSISAATATATATALTLIRAWKGVILLGPLPGIQKQAINQSELAKAGHRYKTEKKKRKKTKVHTVTARMMMLPKPATGSIT